MSMLNDRAREQVRGALEEMAEPVRLVFFEQTLNCETCPEARALVQEVADLSDMVTLETYNVLVDKEKAKEFSVEAAPVLAVVGKKDYGIRFYGTPSGYEFSVLIETIRDVSNGVVPLSEETFEALKAVTSPVHLRVFVTPT